MSMVCLSIYFLFSVFFFPISVLRFQQTDFLHILLDYIYFFFNLFIFDRDRV